MSVSSSYCQRKEPLHRVRNWEFKWWFKFKAFELGAHAQAARTSYFEWNRRLTTELLSVEALKIEPLQIEPFLGAFGSGNSGITGCLNVVVAAALKELLHSSARNGGWFCPGK